MQDAGDWLKEHGRRVIRIASGGEGDPDEGLEATVIAANAISLLLKVRTGNRVVAVKVFDPANRSSSEGFQRELGVIEALAGTGLVPGLKGYSVADAFLVMPWIEGVTLGEALVEAGVPSAAFELGRWFGQFERHMPREVYEANWGDYLGAYAEPGIGSVIDSHGPFLRRLPIAERRIAKNDAFLGNFLKPENGTIIGIDFEAAAFKPPGWDLLLTGRYLARLAPSRIGDIADNLVRGYANPAGLVESEDLNALIRVFCLHTAIGRGP